MDSLCQRRLGELGDLCPAPVWGRVNLAHCVISGEGMCGVEGMRLYLTEADRNC